VSYTSYHQRRALEEQREIFRRINQEIFSFAKRILLEETTEIISASVRPVREGNREFLEFRLKVLPHQVPETTSDTTPEEGEQGNGKHSFEPGGLGG